MMHVKVDRTLLLAVALKSCLLGDHKFQVKWYDPETTPKLLGITLEDDDYDLSAENPEEGKGTNSILYHC